MSKKRILICTGGTGGHIFPAQALAQQLRAKNPDYELLFVGGGLSSNRFFDRDAFPYKEVLSGPFFVRNPFVWLRSCTRLFQGWLQSRNIIANFQPDVVVGFGSYYTFPTLMAAKSKKIPLILHAADSVPGKVIRFLSRYAEVTGIHFPEAARWLRGKTMEVKMPLREGYRFIPGLRLKARNYFQLEPKLLTILISGGSQGASAINQLTADMLINHLKTKLEKFQVIHCTGDAKSAEILQATYKEQGILASVKSFEPRMDLAWTAADMTIARAGASSIAEQIEFEVPGVLIPYPHGSDNHQGKNAEFFVTKIGGGLRFAESSLTPEALAEAILNMIREEKTLLKGMRRAIHLYKNSARRRELCELIDHVLKSKGRS